MSSSGNNSSNNINSGRVIEKNQLINYIEEAKNSTAKNISSYDNLTLGNLTFGQQQPQTQKLNNLKSYNYSNTANQFINQNKNKRFQYNYNSDRKKKKDKQDFQFFQKKEYYNTNTANTSTINIENKSHSEFTLSNYNNNSNNWYSNLVYTLNKDNSVPNLQVTFLLSLKKILRLFRV